MKKLLLGNWVARLAWLMMLSWPMVGLVCDDGSVDGWGGPETINQEDFKVNDTLSIRLYMECYNKNGSYAKGGCRSEARLIHNGMEDTIVFDKYPDGFTYRGGGGGGLFYGGFYTMGYSDDLERILLSVYNLGVGTKHYIFKRKNIENQGGTGFLMCFHPDSTGFLVSQSRRYGNIVTTYYDTISNDYNVIDLGYCPAGHGHVLDRFEKKGVKYQICSDSSLIKTDDTVVIRKDLNIDCFGNNPIYQRIVQ